MMRSFIKKITHPFFKIWARWYYRKPRKYAYKGLSVLVHPEVFPPHLTLSTKLLLDYISKIDLTHKTFLELGCGSGIISLFAAKKGAHVTATDINNNAIDYLKTAASKNNLTIEVLYSDLFENLKDRVFDYIFINPPYYPKKPKNVKEQAWFCGEDFEYFKKLFQQLPNYISKETLVFMILSEDCKIDRIHNMGRQNHLNFNLISEKKSVGEMNFIFRIQVI